MSETELKYQENVAAILRNARGEILICERVSVKGAWQFPQGGVDEGETLEQAMVREVWEEIGVKAWDFTLVERRGPYRYVFGKGRTKRGFHGTALFSVRFHRRGRKHQCRDGAPGVPGVSLGAPFGFRDRVAAGNEERGLCRGVRGLLWRENGGVGMSSVVIAALKPLELQLYADFWDIFSRRRRVPRMRLVGVSGRAGLTARTDLSGYAGR